MKRVGVYAICLLIILGWLYSLTMAQSPQVPALSDQAEQGQSSHQRAGEAGPLTPLMRAKLERSKAILEGLTLEDFDKIATNARALKLLSMESGWNIIQTEEYAAQSSDFRRATDIIVEAAKDKDASRASLGFVAMTVRCVECHTYMRQHRLQQVNSNRQDVE